MQQLVILLLINCSSTCFGVFTPETCWETID